MGLRPEFFGVLLLLIFVGQAGRQQTDTGQRGQDDLIPIALYPSAVCLRDALEEFEAGLLLRSVAVQGVLPHLRAADQQRGGLLAHRDQVTVDVAVGVRAFGEVERFGAVYDEPGRGPEVAHHLLRAIEHFGVLGVGFEHARGYGVNFAEFRPALLGESGEKDVRDGLVEQAVIVRPAELQYPGAVFAHLAVADAVAVVFGEQQHAAFRYDVGTGQQRRLRRSGRRNGQLHERMTVECFFPGEAFEISFPGGGREQGRGLVVGFPIPAERERGAQQRLEAQFDQRGQVGVLHDVVVEALQADAPGVVHVVGLAEGRFPGTDVRPHAGDRFGNDPGHVSLAPRRRFRAGRFRGQIPTFSRSGGGFFAVVCFIHF